MRKTLGILGLMILAAAVTTALVALSPLITLYSLYRGNTHVYEGLCEGLQDWYYVIGKNLLRAN